MINRAALDLLLDGVDGYLHADEPYFLASLAASVKSGSVIVEIGAYRGRSAIALAYGARDGVTVYSVDPHEEHEISGLSFGMADNQAFMQNVSRAGMGTKVCVVALRSIEALVIKRLHPVGLVFIDGAHDYHSVKVDTLMWGDALEVGGLLAIHDSNGTWSEPTQVADEQAANLDWTELDGCGFTRVFRKCDPDDGRWDASDRLE